MPPPAPASPFAALLRRSKFASFDPSIAQVYTSHGGDLHRGNWGFKRPLPLRRRNAYISVRSVDSREQQTEWSNAENQGRWIRMWDEIGCEPRVTMGSPWEQKLGPMAEVNWEVDSEFERKVAPPKEEVETLEAESLETESEGEEVLSEAKALAVDAPIMATPNIHAMSNKEFDKYVERLRTKRTTFKRFLDVSSSLDNPNAPSQTSWERSLKASDRPARKFLSAQQHLKYHDPDSTALEQRPHYSAGLTYSRSSKLQHFLLTKPALGRIVEGKDRSNGYSVSFGGSITSLDKKFREGHTPIKWEELASTGEYKPGRAAEYHMISGKLDDAPVVVGRETQGMGGSVLQIEIKGSSEDGDRKSSPNPHRPGSKEYVSLIEGLQSVPSMTGTYRSWAVPKEVRVSTSKDVLSTLSSIVPPTKKVTGVAKGVGETKGR